MITYDCELCNYQARSRDALTKHHEYRHQKIEHQCYECEMKFKNKHNLKNHIKSIHEDIWLNCNQCESKFASNYALKRHIQGKHGDTVFQCNDCDYKTNYERCLKRHMQLVHIKEKSHKCSECPKAFVRKDHLKRHLQSVHREKDHMDVKSAYTEHPGGVIIHFDALQKVFSKPEEVVKSGFRKTEIFPWDKSHFKNEFDSEKTFPTDDDKSIFKNEFVGEKTFSTDDEVEAAPSPTDDVSSSSVLMESAMDDDVLEFAPGSDW